MMRVTLLIPTLNEAEGIRKTLADLPRQELERRGHRLEVVVIDGLSTDGTPDVARSLGAKVLEEKRRGYGRAYKTGLAKAEGDVVVTADADGTYPLERLPQLLDTLDKERLDFVTVSRFDEMAPRAMSLKHRFGNWILTTTLRILFGVPVRDSQSGMWLIRRKVLDRLPLESFSDSMAFSQEIKIEAFRAPDIEAREVPGAYRARIGMPKLASWRDGIGNLRALLSYGRRRRAFGAT